MNKYQSDCVSNGNNSLLASICLKCHMALQARHDRLLEFVVDKSQGYDCSVNEAINLLKEIGQ